MAAEDTSVLYATTPEGITTITLNRPHVRNAVNASTATKLAHALAAFDRDDTQKVCILTGAGDTFCAGYDLHEVASSGAPSTRPVDALNGGNPAPMGPSRMTLGKPLIAAVAGHAVAGGLELSLLADLRVCDDTAVFGVFCRRFGVPLIDGGTVRLPRVVGLGRAMDMILTGRPVGAAEALAFGLANRVVARGRALEEAREVARSLLGFPQLCMRGDRESAYYAAYEAGGLLDALRHEYEGGARMVELETIAGAARFDKGEGRGGSFKPKGRL
ncbi:enoyl-CoA hydratase/isomerase family protein [Coniochaeta sp. PMI_546]|nr:enoyl-CoA hydratase/isomerase family protein [Coniochaeta sp. PMI_546]